MNIDSFEEFLKNVQKVSERTIKHYSGAIETISKDCNIDLYKVNEIDKLKEVEKIIKENGEYIRKNDAGNNMYSAALSHYETFILYNNKYFKQLMGFSELTPDEHDGSYELVRETVKQYNYIDNNSITYKDADLIYSMTIGTWKSKIEKKEELIEESNLQEPQKKYLHELIKKIADKAENHEYSNSLDGNFGMFGTGFFTFYNSKDDKQDINLSAKQFVDLCKFINNNDNIDFNILEEKLKYPFKGYGIATISQVLHCLKPFVFPILNGKQGEGQLLYKKLGINIDHKNVISTYIDNTRKIQEFRDKYFQWKNYRIFDLIKIEESIEEEKNMEKNYWWLIANPSIWSFSELEIGGIIDYTSINEDGNKRRIYSNFENAKKGDIVIAYEARPTKAIVGLCTIERELKNNTILIKKIENFINPIPYDNVISNEILNNMEAVQNNFQGSLFKITPEEYKELQKLINKVQDNEITQYNKTKFLEEVYIDENEYDKICNLIRRKKNIILQGAPGVGKTFMAKRLAYSMMEIQDKTRILNIQFHQSYSYEDFIEGWRPNENGFGLEKGVFYNFCKTAENDPNNDYFCIIDEINRGNLSKIFGELLMLIENDKRGEKMTLAYSRTSFSVPKNLYIIGMMNTADRSLALIDYALRRRFSFYSVKPAFENDRFIEYKNKFRNDNFNRIIDLIKDLNKEISSDASLGDGFQIGHSYFCNLENVDDLTISSIIEFEIIPLIEEYWFDNISKLKEWKNKLLGVTNNE